MMTFGFGGFGMLFSFLFWIIIAGFVVWALAQALSRSSAPHGGSDISSIATSQSDFTLEILKQRFAKGEITREEFESMRQELAV